MVTGLKMLNSASTKLASQLSPSFGPGGCQAGNVSLGSTEASIEPTAASTTLNNANEANMAEEGRNQRSTTNSCPLIGSSLDRKRLIHDDDKRTLILTGRRFSYVLGKSHDWALLPMDTKCHVSKRDCNALSCG